MEERIGWIDISKGLGMLLVMLAHAPFPDILKKEIYTFHMPLFFFLSGYLFSYTKYTGFTNFFKRRFITLIVPYFSFSFINYIYWVCIYRNLGSNVDKSISIFKPLIGTFYAQRGTQWTLHNGTMWFVACLFLSEIILYIIVKSTNNNIKQICVSLICCSIIGYLYNAYIGKVLPWSIDVSMTAVVFVGMGYIVKNKVNITNINFRYVIVLLLINLVCGFYNKPIDMFGNKYGNYMLFYVSALSGILAFIVFIRLLGRIKILSYIGKNSIIFLALHQFVLFPLIGKVLKYIPIYTIQSKYISLLSGISYTVIASVFLVPIAYIINKYLPFILGKNIFKINKSVKIALKA